VDLDARAARIDRLGLTLRDVPVRLVLPRASIGLVDLSVKGDLSQLTVDLAEPGECPSVFGTLFGHRYVNNFGHQPIDSRRLICSGRWG
jgi:hypothetical protein